jgi:RNA polymerase sigma-70 factor (ECF subfamily)
VDARRSIELAARESYGRLVAYLSARSRDVAAAEDALADAFRAAVETWPATGVPEKPEAWLLTAARRRLIDRARRARVRADAVPMLLAVAEEAQDRAEASDIFPDDRLALLFVCAHPAIDAGVRTPLMLQTVLGLDAVRIASAFLVKPAAMGQRLARAKTRIRDAGIGFELPNARELPGRLQAVAEAIYAAYGSGWDDVTGADPRRKGLTQEALNLGRLLARDMPTEPEALGLLALMLHCEARRAARRSDAGEYIPLSDQDVTLWSRAMIDEADTILAVAERMARLGRFQLEAAIQSMHSRRLGSAPTDWQAITLLYEGLCKIAPTVGAMVGRAAAANEAFGPEIASGLLEAIPSEAVASYQPYWAVSAHLLARMDRRAEADAAFVRAIGLCEDAAMREFLRRRRIGLLKED